RTVASLSLQASLSAAIASFAGGPMRRSASAASERTRGSRSLRAVVRAGIAAASATLTLPRTSTALTRLFMSASRPDRTWLWRIGRLSPAGPDLFRAYTVRTPATASSTITAGPARAPTAASVVHPRPVVWHVRPAYGPPSRHPERPGPAVSHGESVP